MNFNNEVNFLKNKKNLNIFVPKSPPHCFCYGNLTSSIQPNREYLKEDKYHFQTKSS